MAAGWVVKVEGQRCDVMYVSLNAVFVMESLGNLFKKKKVSFWILLSDILT